MMEMKQRWSKLMERVINKLDIMTLGKEHGSFVLERGLLQIALGPCPADLSAEEKAELTLLKRMVDAYYADDAPALLEALNSERMDCSHYPRYALLNAKLREYVAGVVTAPMVMRTLFRIKEFDKDQAVSLHPSQPPKEICHCFDGLYDMLQKIIPVEGDFLRKYVNALMRSYLFQSEEAPRCVLTLLGKSDLEQLIVQQTAHYLKLPLLTICMSDYEDHHAVGNLIGENPVYHDARAGVLAEFVRKNPNGGIIFVSELEKGALEAQMAFDSIIDTGKKFDRFSNKDVDFSNYMLIFTTETGTDLLPANPDRLALVTSLTDDTQRGNLSLSLTYRLLKHNVLLVPELMPYQAAKYCATQYQKKLWKRFPSVDLILDSERLARLMLLHQGGKCNTLALLADLQGFLEDNLLSAALGDGLNAIDVQICTEGADETIVELLDAKSDAFNRAARLMSHLRQQLLFDTETVCSEGVCRIWLRNLRLDQTGLNLHLGEADIPDVQMEDVIGQQEAKEAVQEMVKSQKGGILLFEGPPGTGKTLLAQAAASMGQMPFFAINASDVPASLQGESEKRIRELFARARKEAPSLIFIDEVDFVFTERDQMKESKSLLGELLVQLSGFGKQEDGVLVIMATNRADALDEALCSRVQRIIHFTPATKEDRKTFLRHYCTKDNNWAVKEKDLLSVLDYDCSLRELSHAVKAAQRMQTQKPLSGKDLLEAVRTYCYGKVLSGKQAVSMSTAYHEAAHALIGHFFGLEVLEISVEARNKFAGFCRIRKEEGAISKEMLYALGVQLLAGRAAEIQLLGKQKGFNSGAIRDLAEARELAVRAVEYGFVEPVVCNVKSADAEQIANRILGEFIEEANRLVHDYLPLIQFLAEELMKHKLLTGAALKKCLALCDEKRKEILMDRYS